MVGAKAEIYARTLLESLGVERGVGEVLPLRECIRVIETKRYSKNSILSQEELVSHLNLIVDQVLLSSRYYSLGEAKGIARRMLLVVSSIYRIIENI